MSPLPRFPESRAPVHKPSGATLTRPTIRHAFRWIKEMTIVAHTDGSWSVRLPLGPMAPKAGERFILALAPVVEKRLHADGWLVIALPGGPVMTPATSAQRPYLYLHLVGPSGAPRPGQIPMRPLGVLEAETKRHG